MLWEDWLIIVAVLACLLLSFFFAGSETALIASSRARMLRLEQQGSYQANLVNRLMAMRERLIGALLLGNNAVNIAASSLATSVLLVWFGDVGVIYATVVMTVLVVVFAEVLPKTIAINAPDRMSLLVAQPMSWIVRLLGPVLMAIETLVRWILRLFGVRIGEDQPILSAHEELRGAVDLLHHEDRVEKLDRDMFGGVLDLRELTVSDVMLHRTKMITISADDPPEEIVRAVLAAPVTRLPLWRGSPENIVGILHSKDLLRAIQAAKGDLSKFDIQTIALPAWFVPDVRPLSEQLKAFRRRKTHFALVVDEYGEVMGLVTLEDIIEEIIGKFTTTLPSAAAPLAWDENGTATAEGAMPVREVNRALGLSLPTDGPKTLNGLIVEHLQEIPEADVSIKINNVPMEIVHAQGRTIKTVRIFRPLADVENTETSEV
jgi:Mg2+/Co2+ transporter CorB